ncbi:MAG: YceI family protein [Thermoanaerobaculia bacterium]|jgi:polyisoprenoid-binding protein YceI
MKRSLILAATVVALTPLFAQAADLYVVDKTHSDVSFKVRHLVANTPGRFTDYSANIAIEPKDLAKSTVEFTIQAASINTDNADRDKHLRTEDFFFVDQYPTLGFKSEKIVKKSADQFEVTGVLTMRGVSKRITVPVEFGGFTKDPWGNEKAGFSTDFTVNRKDFGINWNKTLDQGGVVLGEDVKISLSLELNKKK